MEVIREEDLENLADIIWWMKGFMAAKSQEECSFGDCHIESLTKALTNLAEIKKKEAL